MFRTWLSNQFHAQSTEYRRLLHTEVAATKRIYGTINGEVKEMLHKALMSIKVPEMQKWTGNREGTMSIYNQIHKPDFNLILQEFINN